MGYFDSFGVYTVVRNVKNETRLSILPTITISVADGQHVFSKTIQHVQIASDREMPFKIKFSNVYGDSPTLFDVVMEYVHTDYTHISLQVSYDDTLIKHDAGHLTGRIKYWRRNDILSSCLCSDPRQ